MIQAISYYRVSTDKQGETRLGLDAQRDAVQRFASLNNINVIEEFTEIESGKRNNRPVLHSAIDKCKHNHFLLLIAKLDRLGRNVAFISKLMESGIDFIAVDNPHANKFILHMLAAFAEHERDLISTRTKDALKVVKSRGVELGKNAKVLAKKNKARAQAFAEQMKPVIMCLQDDGYETIREIKDELNRKRIATSTGKGKWHLNTVYQLMKRINNLK